MTTAAFPELLKQWRHANGMSQLRLATAAGVSQRHISFLESGRSNPSPVMVFALSEALTIPLRDRNDLLLAAGFAPKYRQSALDAPEMDLVRTAIDRLLGAAEPYPAIVFDRLYNVVRSNTGAARLIGFLFDPDRMSDPTLPQNALRAVLHPDGCRDAVENWSELAAILLRRLRAETTAVHRRDAAVALLDEVASYPGVPEDWRSHGGDDWRQPMLTVTFARNGTRFSLFSTIAMLGAPYDVTLQDIRIETYFPADDAAKAFFEGGTS